MDNAESNVIGYGSDGHPITDAPHDAQEGPQRAESTETGQDTATGGADAPESLGRVTDSDDVRGQVTRLAREMGSLRGQLASFMDSINGVVVTHRSDTANLTVEVRALATKVDSLAHTIERVPALAARSDVAQARARRGRGE